MIVDAYHDRLLLNYGARVSSTDLMDETIAKAHAKFEKLSGRKSISYRQWLWRIERDK